MGGRIGGIEVERIEKEEEKGRALMLRGRGGWEQMKCRRKRWREESDEGKEKNIRREGKGKRKRGEKREKVENTPRRET